MNNWNFWGPELDEAVVSLCWNQPEPYLAETLRQLDLKTHLSQPHCQHILESIRLCYTELGATDWHTVLCCLSEQGLLKEVGEDKQLLDRIFRNPGYGSLFKWYINTLKAIAQQRAVDPVTPLYLFTGGRGRIVPNRAVRRDSVPTDVGEVRVCGKRYRLAGWRDGEGLDIKLTPQPSRKG